MQLRIFNVLYILLRLYLITIFRLDLSKLIPLKLICYRGNFIVTNSLLSWVLNLIKTFTAERFQGTRVSLSNREKRNGTRTRTTCSGRLSKSNSRNCRSTGAGISVVMEFNATFFNWFLLERKSFFLYFSTFILMVVHNNGV